MHVATLFDVPEPVETPPFSLRVVQSDVRITNPHVDEPDGLQSIFESMHDENCDPLPELTEPQKTEARLWWPLRRIYETYLADWRNDQRINGKIRGGTLQKERQSVRCFDRWDSDPQRAPADWPSGIKWTGLPAGHLAQKYVERWLRSRLDQGYSTGTMEPRWNHVRTVLNMLRRMGIVDAVPTVDYSLVVESFQKAIGDLEDDDLVPSNYSAKQLVDVYQRLHEADLRAAWVLGCNCGPRSVDLFSLFWTTNVRLGDERRPELFYRARKTGKRHWVPLHPITVKHLRRLIALQGHLDPQHPEGLVFPRLTSVSADPERGRPARRRNDRIKAIMQMVGIPIEGDFERPWQVLRSTCNSMLNNHRAGAGQLVTHGKDADVSSTHYWNHHPTLVEAIATMPLPVEFDL